MQFSTIFVSLITLASSALAAPAADITAVAQEKRFAGGWCGVHVRVQDRDTTKVFVKVYDANQFLVADQEFDGTAGSVHGTITAQNGMGSDLSINANNGVGDVASFEYGSDYWVSGSPSSTNSHCSVGAWDTPNIYLDRRNIQMDCGFSC